MIGLAWFVLAAGPVLHEPIPSDPAEDARLGVAIEGDLPAAIETPEGLVRAPDPRRAPAPAPPRPPGAESPVTSAPPNAVFSPDRHTERPDVLPYDDPFTPSTAPFKRLLAFDSVSAQYTLGVRDPRLVAMSSHVLPAVDGSDDRFFADLSIDLAPGHPARVPSVGPGAKIVHARAGLGAAEVPVRFFRDGADNWFAESETPARARLVMELAAPHASFAGNIGDPSWGDLPRVPPLPANVARDAAEVAARIGVSRAQSPREVVGKLVAYYRSFVDSQEEPRGERSVYLDLALSKKGVCRHRAFAFLVTALGLGLPARMIANEAHAWVEVNDGSMWHRIDLGGAGRALEASTIADAPRHEVPPDPFAWPTSAEPGDALGQSTRTANASPGSNGNATSSAASTPNASSNAPPNPAAPPSPPPPLPHDDRPPSTVTLTLVDPDPHRSSPLHVRGAVTAEGAPCAGLLVELVLRDARGREVPLGALATTADGSYAGAVVVPPSAALGDYDLVARTLGDARCGRGGGP
jgi:hypothetical protein